MITIKKINISYIMDVVLTFFNVRICSIKNILVKQIQKNEYTQEDLENMVNSSINLAYYLKEE